MNITIVGNIICFTGALIMVLSGFIKNKTKILLSQAVQYTIMGAGNLVLGGISGGIADFVSVVRNLISLKWEFKLPHKIIFIAIQIALTAIFNDAGFIGWLPTAAACIFTWCLDTKSEILIKILIMLAQTMWAIYDVSIKNYATLVFDILTVFSNLIGIFMILHKRKTEKKSGEAQTEILSEETPDAVNQENLISE